jgi:hypothetical protein
MTFSGKEPRLNYYNFVHRLLPKLVFTDLDDFCTGITQPQSQYLQLIWQKLGQELEITTEPKEKFEIKTVILSELRRLHLIQLPTPHFPLEGFALGIVVDLSFVSSPVITIKNIHPRYFTLELNGETTDPMQPRNYFCEWKIEGKHLNYGELASHSLKTFEQAIRRQLEEI